MAAEGGVNHRSVVVELLTAALKPADPYKAVLNALRAASPHAEGKVYVLGAGKAGAAMARAVEEAVGERVAEGLVLVKEGYTSEQPLQRIQLVEAGHPIPDQRGVEATEHLLEIAGRAGHGDLVVCLISGGGSALLAAPAEGITLEDVQTTTQLLLRAGATINELNAVRKHLSRVSGGLLAQRIAPAHTLSLILSDVIGSPLDVIASGPTAPDPTTYREALDIVGRHGLAEQVPASVLERLREGAKGDLAETPKPGDPVFELVTNRIIASNVLAVEAAANGAREMGLDTAIASTYLQGEAREVGIVLAGIAKEIATYGRPVKCPGCVLFGGETTVTVRGNGIGGRNSEVALGAALALDGWGPDLLVASLATDGGDGPSPGAGAIADGTTIARSKSMGLDPYQALANNDSYTFWQKLGDDIVTGPTGTNVNDLIGVFVFR